MRIIVVVGARPNFIKIGPLMPAFAAAGIDAPIAHTGQHYDTTMSEVFFSDLDLPTPTWFLGVGSGTHAVQTGRAMIALEELLVAEKPDALFVVGDVNSTLAGALAASKIGVPVVHLEAGLRSGDMSMPEELNRLVTDQLSSLLLTPTPTAVDNLMAEGIDADRVDFVGNIMAESVLRNAPGLEDRGVETRMSLTPGEFVLATVHRPENTDNRDHLCQIVSAFSALELPVVFPVHPRTRPLLADAGLDESSSHVRLIDPVGYLDMLALQSAAAVVVTDSGGIQEETCMLHTPCVTVRRNTERQITLEVGSNRLVSADREQIVEGVSDALAGTREWPLPERWDLDVATRVVAALERGVTPLAR
jgi:UDP-N-acetylglucosamine 2-epimerase (non-hydrolysing)